MPSSNQLPDGHYRTGNPIASYLAALPRRGEVALMGEDEVTQPAAVRNFVEPRVQSQAGGVSTGALVTIRAESRLLLLGDPGSGKSTVIRVLAHQLALECLRSPSSACPVLVEASALLPPGEDSWMWLATAASSLAGCDERVAVFLAAALEAGKAHLFVDGLDGIADLSRRTLVARTLRTLGERSPGLRICVSARPMGAGSDGLMNWLKVWSLLPLDDAQAQSLLSLLTGSAQDVERQLAMRPWLTAIARGNPLLLNLLSLYTSEHGFQTPRSRVQLFEDMTDALLARDRLAVATQVPVEILHTVHEIAAVSMSRAGKTTLSIAELKDAVARDPISIFTEDSELSLRIALERAVLLVQTAPGQVSFEHRAFQDFYLGRAIAQDFTIISSLPPGDLSEPLAFAAGLAADPLPLIKAAYERHGVTAAARCCSDLRRPGHLERRSLAKIVLDDLGPDFHWHLLGILEAGSVASDSTDGPTPDDSPFGLLQALWEALPRSGASADARGRGLENFAVALLETYFEVVGIRQRHPAGEVDVICENMNFDPFWANYPGDIWVECKNTEDRATKGQVNEFLGKLMASRSHIGFFFSTSGFTKDAMDRVKAVASDRSAPLIAPISGQDIENLLAQRPDLPRFFKAMIRKVA